jgi:hypothetical protein
MRCLLRYPPWAGGTGERVAAILPFIRILFFFNLTCFSLHKIILQADINLRRRFINFGTSHK